MSTTIPGLEKYRDLFELVRNTSRSFIDDLEYETRELAPDAGELPHDHPVAELLLFVDDIVGVVCGLQMDAQALLDEVGDDE